MNKDFNDMAGDNRDADRYDPVSLMFKERIIMVHGEVNGQMAYNIIAQLKKLEYMDPSSPIKMLINSPGGSVIDGLAIYDIMRESKCKIITIGNGMQASMGSILLAAGDERSMTKNSNLMIHQIASGSQGKASDLQVGISFSHKLHEMLKNIYVRHVGLTHEFWDIALERDTWLTADQALKMGFIHKIVEDSPGKAAAYESESQRQGFRKAAEAQVPKTAEEIMRVINNASADGGKYADIRPELVTALAGFPEFWTETKKAEMAAKAAATAVANDDTPAAEASVAARKAKKVPAPKKAL